MLSDFLFTKNKLERALDATWLRNEVISQNIANVDTPGYKRKEVRFEEYLDKELGSSTGGDENIPIRVTEDSTKSSYRADGNNVDIENESALLAANSLRYNTLIQKMNGDFQRLRSVITGGR